MAFYIGLFIISVLLVMISKKDNTAKIGYLILWFVYAFRDKVSVDDSGYISAFEKINLGWKFDVEWSYQALSKFASSIGLNYKFVFFVYATVSFVFLIKAVDLLFETNAKKGFYLACFYGTIFVTAMSVMRQFLAACICFYAIVSYLKRKSFKCSAFLIGLAVIIHGGAIVALPLLLICRFQGKLSYSKKILIMILCIVGGYGNIVGNILRIGMRFLPASYQLYSNAISGSYSSAGGTVSIILALMFLLQCFISYRAGVDYPQNEEVDALEFGQLLYLGLLFLFVRAGVANRLSITFIPFIASLPYTFSLRVRENQRKMIWFVFVVAMLILYVMSIKQTATIYKGTFIPYQWSFDFKG